MDASDMRPNSAVTFIDAITGAGGRRRVWARNAFLAIAGSLFIAACAKIRIGGPVPFTMQSWAVLLLGALLGSRRGALAAIAYLCEGAVGLPVFAGSTAGPAYMLGITGGYLLGFVPAALVVGLLAERGWDRRLATAVVAIGIGDAIILTCGILWLAPVVGLGASLDMGLRPFWLADLLKVFLAAAALPGAWRMARRADGHP